MSKFINVFGNTNADISTVTEGDNFIQFANANLVPKGGFSAPLYVMWELTSGCPNKCIYCYNDSHNRRTQELSSKKKMEIANQLIEAGIFQVCLTGGEPLACPEYLDLLR